MLANAMEALFLGVVSWALWKLSSLCRTYLPCLQHHAQLFALQTTRTVAVRNALVLRTDIKHRVSQSSIMQGVPLVLFDLAL